GVIEYNVSYNGYDQSYSSPLCFVDLLDREGKFVARDITTLAGRIEIDSPRLWWPYLMDSEPGYLYTLQVRLASPQLGTKDVYRLPVGIRTVKWNNTSLLINGRPLYLRGFGKHEDSDLYATILRQAPFSRPNRDSNPDFPVIRRPVQHESDALGDGPTG
ncbi:unnamed protein product, partial [Timema podura]|nr:unnamed protein product [Timema podura]